MANSSPAKFELKPSAWEEHCVTIEPPSLQFRKVESLIASAQQLEQFHYLLSSASRASTVKLSCNYCETLDFGVRQLGQKIYGAYIANCTFLLPIRC